MALDTVPSISGLGWPKRRVDQASGPTPGQQAGSSDTASPTTGAHAGSCATRHPEIDWTVPPEASLTELPALDELDNHSRDIPFRFRHVSARTPAVCVVYDWRPKRHPAQILVGDALGSPRRSEGREPVPRGVLPRTSSVILAKVCSSPGTFADLASRLLRVAVRRGRARAGAKITAVAPTLDARLHVAELAAFARSVLEHPDPVEFGQKGGRGDGSARVEDVPGPSLAAR